MLAYISSWFFLPPPNPALIMQQLNSEREDDIYEGAKQLMSFNTAQPQYHLKILNKNIISRLISLQLRKNLESDTRSTLVGALANMALLGKESKREVVENGGLVCFVDLISSGTSSKKEKIHAALGIINTIEDDEFIDSVDERMVAGLVGLLANRDAELTTHAAGALTNIATSAKNAKLIVDRNALPYLARMLENGTVQQKVQAAGVLMNVAEADVEIKLQIIQLRVTKGLFWLLQNGSRAGKARASSLLLDLCQIPEGGVIQELNTYGTKVILADIVVNGSKLERQAAEPLLDLVTNTSFIPEPPTRKSQLPEIIEPTPNVSTLPVSTLPTRSIEIR